MLQETLQCHVHTKVYTDLLLIDHNHHMMLKVFSEHAPTIFPCINSTKCTLGHAVQHTNHSSVHALICLSGYATTFDSLNYSSIHRYVYIVVLWLQQGKDLGAKALTEDNELCAVACNC